MRPLPNEENNENNVHSWGIDKTLRWYRRGKKKMDRELRIESLMHKVRNLDLYAKQMMQLELGAMKRIQHNRHKVVGVDTESSDGNTAEEDADNAHDDCEHEICHKVACKIG